CPGKAGGQKAVPSLEPRSTCGCWTWALLIATMNLLVFFINLLLMLVIFTIVLLPTIVVVYFGFQCHSRVLHSTARYCRTILDDNSSSALIILGFVIMSPLIVVAMATYCSLARRLRLLMCFQPCSRALYKGAPGRTSWRSPVASGSLQALPGLGKRSQRQCLALRHLDVA
uniref:Transmembrane protein 88 n=1 Tax=Phasianus colchicus TaxID=9054 RepID=A0A669QVC3_PHACC